MKGEVKALVQAGKVTPAALGQSLGMAGLNIGKVVADINNVTKKYEGMKVPVVISYDLKTKEYEIEVRLPPTSQLILKEAGIQKGAGNISFEQAVKVAKTKEESLGKDLKKAVLQVLGTCVSMGVTVDGKNAKEIQGLVKEGKFDNVLV